MDTYEEAVRFIEQTYKYGAHPGSENAARLLALLGSPEESLNIVHVAGTNGKGSVCAFLADMLTACGHRTGLFISPHLVDIRERIQLDRSLISREDFLAAFRKVENAVQALASQGYTGITYFDYLFAIGMCYFARKQADYVILETGLGGLLDSTNAVRHPVLTIITSISLDHTEVLGDTLEKIALQKAGILKPGTPLIFCSDEPEACRAITAKARQKSVPSLGISQRDCTLLSIEDARLTFEFHPAFQPPVALTVSSAALYQMENAAISYTAALLLENLLPPGAQMEVSQPAKSLPCRTHTAANGPIPEAAARIQNALSQSRWEGRMEQVAPNIYLDGAHNADGIRMLLATLQAMPEAPAALLFTAVKEKDTERMIREICESGLFRRYILTSLDSPRAIPAEALKRQFQKYTNMPIEIFPSPGDAFLYGCSTRQEGEILLAAGSLYLVGAIKEITSQFT